MITFLIILLAYSIFAFGYSVGVFCERCSHREECQEHQRLLEQERKRWVA